MRELEEHILKLEKRLLQNEVRISATKIEELLSDNFYEFCSSGKIYHYKKGDTFSMAVDSYTWEIIEFKIEDLSEDCILATYKLTKHNEFDDSKKYSLRSSIWKLFDSRWKMTFHQGTPTE